MNETSTIYQNNPNFCLFCLVGFIILSRNFKKFCLQIIQPLNEGRYLQDMKNTSVKISFKKQVKISNMKPV